jgi:hypothetical protein
MANSRPPSPTKPESFGMGYFSAPFERFARDEAFQDWASAFTLLGGYPLTPELTFAEASSFPQ